MKGKWKKFTWNALINGRPDDVDKLLLALKPTGVETLSMHSSKQDYISALGMISSSTKKTKSHCTYECNLSKVMYVLFTSLYWNRATFRKEIWAIFSALVCSANLNSCLHLWKGNVLFCQAVVRSSPSALWSS